MENSIAFPHLGIYLNDVGNHFTIFGFDIAYYGVIVGLGILAGVAIAVLEARRTGQDTDNYFDLAIYEIIFSVIGARLYYVIFSWDLYKDNLLNIFNLRQGGLAIYGAVIAAVITAFVYARVKHLSAPLICDTACLGLVAGQMIGRWGNFFNREAFGEYTDGLFAMRLPVDSVRSQDITERMWEHVQTIDGIEFIQVSPTFLYESCWCLLVLIVLLLYRKHKKFDGEVFLMYLMGYGLGRVWIEGLRTDSLMLPFLNMKVSQLLAGTLVVASLILIIVNRRRASRRQAAGDMPQDAAGGPPQDEPKDTPQDAPEDAPEDPPEMHKDV